MLLGAAMALALPLTLLHSPTTPIPDFNVQPLIEMDIADVSASVREQIAQDIKTDMDDAYDLLVGKTKYNLPLAHALSE